MSKRARRAHRKGHRRRIMNALVHHTPDQLRDGLRRACLGQLNARFREVEAELRLAGFLTGPDTLTRAGWRYLRSGSELTAA